MPWTKNKWAVVWLIAVLPAFLAGTGCVSSATIARHAVEAPNHQSYGAKTLKQFAFLTTNFTVMQVPVGPPPAALELMVIEPGDYGACMTSSITARRPTRTDPHGHMFTFAFGFTNYPIKPRLETNHIRGTVFLLHGYGLNKEMMLPWGLVLAQAGYRAVLVDLRGHGRSTGDRIYFGRVERTDLAQCLDALEQRRRVPGAGRGVGHFLRGGGGLAMGGGGSAGAMCDGHLALFGPGHGHGGISQGVCAAVDVGSGPESGGHRGAPACRGMAGLHYGNGGARAEGAGAVCAGRE